MPEIAGALLLGFWKRGLTRGEGSLRFLLLLGLILGVCKDKGSLRFWSWIKRKWFSFFFNQQKEKKKERVFIVIPLFRIPPVAKRVPPILRLLNPSSSFLFVLSFYREEMGKTNVSILLGFGVCKKWEILGLINSCYQVGLWGAIGCRALSREQGCGQRFVGAGIFIEEEKMGELAIKKKIPSSLRSWRRRKKGGLVYWFRFWGGRFKCFRVG